MFELKFSIANEAFDQPATEIARILRAIARKVERGADPGMIQDMNGNIVGSWTIWAERAAS